MRFRPAGPDRASSRRTTSAVRVSQSRIRTWDIPEDRQAEAKQWIDAHGVIHQDDPVVLRETGTDDTAKDPPQVQQGDTYWLVPRDLLPEN